MRAQSGLVFVRIETLRHKRAKKAVRLIHATHVNKGRRYPYSSERQLGRA